MMPNQNGINSDWRTFRVSVDNVEALTGYNFFSNVPVSIQAAIESVVDSQPIPDSSMLLDDYALDEVRAEQIFGIGDQ
jgi:hypothetical protein